MRQGSPLPEQATSPVHSVRQAVIQTDQPIRARETKSGIHRVLGLESSSAR